MMFEQVPHISLYSVDPGLGHPQVRGQHKRIFRIMICDHLKVRDYKTMLKLFNVIITEAPDYEADNVFVAFPINAILNWPMGTDAGIAAFLNPKVNAEFKKIFDVWSNFLTSPDSRYVLTTEDNGWFGPAASEAMPDFAATYVCDPKASYHGFKSWDDFFTRTFRPGVRPVESPDDDTVVNCACESRIYCIASDVKTVDQFWLKGECYSLKHMLNNDPFTPLFAGGTVFQAFLAATKYHRWHSPINGVVVKIVMVPGTYYAASPAMGFRNPAGPDPSAQNSSQSFLTAVATRALIFLRSNNPGIGLMCFMAVGMAEVSTCEVMVKEGQRIKKGEQLGMFHFGGSTHCLIFRPETKITFNANYPVDADVPINVSLATVSR